MWYTSGKVVATAYSYRKSNNISLYGCLIQGTEAKLPCLFLPNNTDEISLTPEKANGDSSEIQPASH